MKKSHAAGNVSLAIAKKMAEAVEQTALEMHVPVVFSVVDSGANTLLVQRMDQAFITSYEIALNKAWTACCLKKPTHEITHDVQPGQSLYGLQLSNQQRIVIFGGGFPIIENGQIIGAVGVSGGTVEQDIQLATVALNCFSQN
ncbi:heme-binding protein [Buttiauxella sp. 3AFRM03]|uniref:GlcG/HbpS family heme-binding protein n=1 Tax=Buttiauxella sp. 3AFRM03 TaxID=2479367 RepID=UPI000EF84D00|nr:heme-binding protein [Buttiauxella sp. 3AFRM03]AYN30098.1 heme-binding protein [Buttiauxella sp. 3AFRM03]